jgi:hypothetical protein
VGERVRRYPVSATRHFLEEFRALPDPIAQKVSSAVATIRECGAYHSGLATQKISRNPDQRFRLMDLDYSYRMVAVIEGRAVLLVKVGPHDPDRSAGVRPRHFASTRSAPQSIPSR